MTPWPGRNESPLRSAMSALCTCLPRAQLVVRASLTDPSLSFCSKHILKRMVLSVRLFVQADLADLYTIVTWMKGHVNQRLHPCARLPPAVSQASWLSFVRPFCDVFDNCRQRRLILAPPTDALSTTRVRFDAIPELFPGYLTPKSAVSTNFLNAAQTLDKQSANAAVCELECVCRG